MNLSDIVLLAIALSIDAFVVSFSYGLCIEQRNRINSILLGATTGLFQGVMPIIGYLFTDIIKSYIEPYSKITVFIIFMYLGINFIIEGFRRNPTESRVKICARSLLLIGIATSIDALSSGITLSLTNSPVIISALIIGFTTLFNSIFGYWLGHFLKNLTARYFDILGGIILIILAVKYI